MKQCWLVNERSGNNRGAEVLRELKSAGLDGLTALPIDFRNLRGQLEQARGHHAIAVAGGDGTCASVLTDANLPEIPVAAVPLGTANDLAIELGTAGAFAGKRWRDIPKLVEGLEESKLATWSLRMNGVERPFCNYVSLGYEGAVVNDFSKWRAGSIYQSRMLNKVMYFWFGLRRLGGFLPSLQLQSSDGVRVPVASKRGVLVTNVKSHMGLGIASDQVFYHDEMIEALVPSSPVDYVRMVVSRYGLMKPLKPIASSKQLSIEGVPPGVPVQVDGEFFTESDGSPIQIQFRRAVRVLSTSSGAL